MSREIFFEFFLFQCFNVHELGQVYKAFLFSYLLITLYKGLITLYKGLSISISQGLSYLLSSANNLIDGDANEFYNWAKSYCMSHENR